MTRGLYDARAASGAKTVFNVEHVVIRDAHSDAPHVTYDIDGSEYRIDCDHVARSDGFHGISGQTISLTLRHEYEKLHPFGWLGILSETPPVNEELIYASSDRGFALCSMRNVNHSRYYIQCSLSDSADDWTDAAIWQELKRHIPTHAAEQLLTGPSIEKSIALLRSFVTVPMRWGWLFLCGDATHILPPTGAKGLNAAASDIHYLYHGLLQHHAEGDNEGLDRYSERALARAWKAERFSWWTTNLLHRYPDQSPFQSQDAAGRDRISALQPRGTKRDGPKLYRSALSKPDRAAPHRKETPSMTDRFEKDMAVRRSVLGDAHVDRTVAARTVFDEPFQTLITEAAWDNVWASERSILTLALLAALRNFDKLPMHIRATARTGASKTDVLEAFQHVAIYAGVPRANPALKLAMQTYAEME